MRPRRVPARSLLRPWVADPWGRKQWPTRSSKQPRHERLGKLPLPKSPLRAKSKLTNSLDTLSFGRGVATASVAEAERQPTRVPVGQTMQYPYSVGIIATSVPASQRSTTDLLHLLFLLLPSPRFSSCGTAKPRDSTHGLCQRRAWISTAWSRCLSSSQAIWIVLDIAASPFEATPSHRYWHSSGS